MATQNPELDIATALQTATYGTLGTNLFIGPVRAESVTPAIPRIAIFVASITGGPTPDGTFGTPSSLRQAPVQVRTRGTVYATERARAQAIYDTLALGTLTGYLIVQPLSAAPLFLGQDERGAYEWSFTVLAWYDAV